MKRSSTSLQKNRKVSIIESPLKSDVKPYSSGKLHRNNSSFKITINRNPNKMQEEKQRQLSSISGRKKQQQKNGIKRLSSKASNPSSPLKSVFQNNRKTPTSLVTNRSNKPIPQQIIAYIKKKEDVQIVEHFQEYKKQFYLKSKVLHNFIYESDEPEKIKNTYLNETDSHYRNGLEAMMLKLFREGVIVPQSFNNLRAEAVQEIQKWVIGWIHRKMSYGQMVEEEQTQIAVVENVIRELQDYQRLTNSQDTSF